MDGSSPIGDLRHCSAPLTGGWPISLGPRRRLGIHALRLTAKHGTQHMSEDRCMHAHTLMPLPRHQNPARSGANMGIDAGCNALNSDSACSSRAAWRVAPPDTMHPSLRAILINTAYDFHWRCLRNVGSTAKLEVHDGGSAIEGTLPRCAAEGYWV